MATVTVRTLPWYAPPRVAQAVRQVRRYPLIPVGLLMFLLVIPAVVYDRDLRGLHDRATGTVVVRR